MRGTAAKCYRALWYEDGQDGRETLTCPGIVGGSPDTMSAARNCNLAKDDFRTSVLTLKTLRKQDAVTLLAERFRRDDNVAATLNGMGAARLNLKQAYRHIPMLSERPLKLGFTWSKHGRVIKRTSIPEARRLLERRRNNPQAQLELNRLLALPPTEMLARMRSVCPHLRANIVFQQSSSGPDRRLIQAPLPILVPLRSGDALPEFVPISLEPTGGARLQRSDVRIEDEPFLPSIHIHRYRARFR
jgi:hypothetical protein